MSVLNESLEMRSLRLLCERRGDELWYLKYRLSGYVNDWRSGTLDANEAMISIQALVHAYTRPSPAPKDGGADA